MNIRDFDFTRNGVLRREARKSLPLTFRSAKHGITKDRWLAIPDLFYDRGPLGKLCPRMDIQDPFKGYERRGIVLGSTYDIVMGNLIVQEYIQSKTQRCDCCGRPTLHRSACLCPECEASIRSTTFRNLSRMERDF